ncbi:hypothetical protein BH11MYX2_BH11MYX2_39750 [soil metagenome]
MMSRFWFAIAATALCACVPTHKGTVHARIESAQTELTKKNFVAAEADLESARAGLFDEPDPDAAETIADLMARADAAIIEAAVASEAMRAGDDLQAIDTLHRMHIKLRGVGGNDAVAAKITDAINVHAALAMQPHEAAKELTDVTPLFALAKYPELNDENRRRLTMLSGKAWRVLSGRANATNHPLLVRAFTGLAARYSGAAMDDGDALVQTELAPYRRGTVATVNLTPECAMLGPVKQRLDQKGAFQVDATISVTNCQRSSSSNTEEYDEAYYVDVPYTAHEKWNEQVCTTTRVPIYYCVNPYLRNGCSMSSETTSSYECHTIERDEDVTRYRHEPRTRKATRVVTTSSWSAQASWTRTFNGTTDPETTATLTASTRSSSNDSTFVDSVVTRFNGNFTEPVAKAMADKAAELRAAGDQAIAAGSIDEGEADLVRVTLLGGDPGTYFTTTYRVSGQDLYDAFKPRGATASADKLVETEPLPEITHVRKQVMKSFAIARFNSTFPPELAQVEGVYFTTGFGTLVAPTKTINGESVGGGYAPVFSPRVGTAALSRILNRTAGFGFWDDASVVGAAGYAAGKDTDGSRGFSGASTGQYTGVVGYHAETFQVLAGARADVTYLKLAGTTGNSTGLQYFGDFGLRISEKSSLSAAAWYPTGYGDSRYGAEIYLAGHTEKSEYSQGQGGATKIQTGYLTLRGELMELDACAAHSGDCVDVPDYRAWSFVLGFGAVYQ